MVSNANTVNRKGKTMSSSYMECVKTGAIIQINDHAGNPNRWAKGIFTVLVQVTL